MNKECPVCGEEIQDQGVQVRAGSKDVGVCCDDCADKVREDPQRYAGASGSSPSTRR